MKRSRLFLIIVLILLVINAAFFIAWHALGGKESLKAYLEEVVGKALDGKLKIASYNIGDRQVYAEGISFAKADSSIVLEVPNLRVNYDLLRFLFTGFKIRHLLRDIEVNSPTVWLRIKPSEEEKPPSPFELPDLLPYFTKANLNEGTLHLDLVIALKLGEGELLNIKEEISKIQISAINDKVTKVKVSAALPKGGRLDAEGTLDKGRVQLATAQVNAYQPSHIHHPALGNPTSEINLDVSVTQADPKANFEIEGKALMWNTRAHIFDAYPVSLPFLSAELQDGKLNVSLANSTVGNSRLGGQISINNLMQRPSLAPSTVNTTVDLGMFHPSLSGVVSANLKAEGSFRNLNAELSASSRHINVFGQAISAMELNGSYQDGMVQVNNLHANWMEHQLSAKGSLDPEALSLSMNLLGSPMPSARELAINLDAELDLALYADLPEVKASFRTLSVTRNGLSVNNLAGRLNLFPTDEQPIQNYFIDCDLRNPGGQRLSVVGDLLDRSLSLNVDFDTISLADIYPHELIDRFTPQVRGSVEGIIHRDKVFAHTDLFVGLEGDFEYATHLQASGSYNLKSGDAGLILSTQKGSLNGALLEFDLAAEMQNQIVSIHSFRVNDVIFATGVVPLNDPLSSSARFNVVNVSTDDFTQFLPDIQLELPHIEDLTLYGDYNLEGDRYLECSLITGPVSVQGLKPLSTILSLRGPPDAVILDGKIISSAKNIAQIGGAIDWDKGFLVDIAAQLSSALISEVVEDLPVQVAISGDLGFSWGSKDSKQPGMTLAADITAPLLVIPEIIELEDIRIKAHQGPQALVVDEFYVESKDFGKVKGVGGLDYNFITGNFFEGNNRLKISAESDIFGWLEKNIDYILEAEGNVYLSCELGTHEEQFMVKTGNLDIRNGYLQIKDQTEPITSINMAASILDNRVDVQRGSLVMGNGRLRFFNEFEEDTSNHFAISFLDLGVFKMAIDEPGILANIPFFTTARNLSKVMLRGRNTPYLSVVGPFDDMKIIGDVFVSDAQALYPPNTSNLLNLIYSFRGVLSRPEVEQDRDATIPLPFNLDIKIHLGDNVRYVTYPLKLDVLPGGLLHLVYDGQEWSAKEAKFNSERGQIDFLGNVFHAERLELSILESQDLFILDGSFIKRSADGTIITLTLSTSRDSSKPLFERLEFNLTSDNPQDHSISDILARLRYSQPSGGMDSDQEIHLQDEALSLISDNLNTQLVSAMFYPLENQIRRIFRLDGFSINTGFIQNLFSEYSNDPDKLAQYMDLEHLMSDIAQFSSTILLNNLSISASKYLARMVYLEYTLGLQEATDLQKRTSILVSHDTSLRMFLPRQLKLGYTFKYEPQDTRFSHEVMLERSFRFWGL